MLVLRKPRSGILVTRMLPGVWLIGLLVLLLAPVPETSVQLDVPLVVSDQHYWVHPSDERLSGGASYIVHENATIEFVEENSAGSALCKHNSTVNKLNCAWMQNDIMRRAAIDLNPLLPSQAFYYTWVGNGYEFHASRLTPLIVYLTVSVFAALALWIRRL